MQNPEKEKLTTDQVIVQMNEQNLKLKQLLEPEFKNPASGGQEKVQNLVRTQTLRRLNISKQNSRFAEINYPYPTKSFHESEELKSLNNEDNDHTSTDEDEDCDDDVEAEQDTNNKYQKKKKRNIRWRALIEWISFFTILTCLICSLTVRSLKNKVEWDLKIWRWCLMAMVLICGRLLSGWIVSVLVFLIERNFMLREKVLYFVFGLRKSFQNFFWLALVLLAWTCMLNPELKNNNKFLKKLFLVLISVLLGTSIWLIKILLVKILASSFHVAAFFDRMKESVFHNYILERLSGKPLLDEVISVREAPPPASKRKLKPFKPFPVREAKSSGSSRIDIERLRKLSLETTTSASSVKKLVNYVRSSGLSTISRDINEFGKAESEITSELEAKNCAKRTFKNVAKSGVNYIEEADLERFLHKEEIQIIFPSFEGAIEARRITKSSFKNWVVRAYDERRKLAHSLNDAKTAVQQLHRIASAIVIVIIIVLSLLVTGVATTKVILVVTSQLLLVGFMFKNTCKAIFESIVFVFIMHPFDAGDRCVIDGVQMVVEEMNILTTVFLRYDMEKIYYPNSILLTKPISNFRRSPEMNDTVEFTIDVSTPAQTVKDLKNTIQTYIESKPKHWNPKHSVIVKEIENMNKMKMSLVVLHTMNYQDIPERNKRRTKLILELKNIFEKLNIKYHLLPQQVILIQNI